MEIKLTLTIEEVNLVLGALRKLPMEMVVDTHGKIFDQAQQQVKEHDKTQNEAKDENDNLTLCAKKQKQS